MIEQNLITNLGLQFHHIGVACKSVEDELQTFTALGYETEGDTFKDENQGIKGVIIKAPNQPTYELLENLPGSTTLDTFLQKGIKYYHLCYTTSDFEQARKTLPAQGWYVLSDIKSAVIFNQVFFVVNRAGHIIEIAQPLD